MASNSIKRINIQNEEIRALREELKTAQANTAYFEHLATTREKSLIPYQETLKDRDTKIAELEKQIDWLREELSDCTMAIEASKKDHAESCAFAKQEMDKVMENTLFIAHDNKRLKAIVQAIMESL